MEAKREKRKRFRGESRSVAVATQSTLFARVLFESDYMPMIGS